MSATAQASVTLQGATALILCRHGLLGEGIAARLRERGVSVVVLNRCDSADVATALADHPTVVVAEWLTDECRGLIATLSPSSRIVDVGNVVVRGCPDAAHLVRFDEILDALAA